MTLPLGPGARGPRPCPVLWFVPLLFEFLSCHPGMILADFGAEVIRVDRASQSARSFPLHPRDFSPFRLLMGGGVERKTERHHGYQELYPFAPRQSG